MAKNKTSFSLADLEGKGFVKQADGTYSKVTVKKTPFMKDVEEKSLIEKKEVVITPEFEYNSVKLEWFIPYQMPSKKNSQQLFVNKATGRPGTTTSQRYKDYISVTKMYWQIFSREFRAVVERLELKYPLDIEFTFVRKTKQKFDYIGICQSAQDIMVDFGFIPDDNHSYIKPHFADAEVNKANPGTRIKIILK